MKYTVVMSQVEQPLQSSTSSTPAALSALDLAETAMNMSGSNVEAQSQPKPQQQQQQHFQRLRKRRVSLSIPAAVHVMVYKGSIDKRNSRICHDLDEVNDWHPTLSECQLVRSASPRCFMNRPNNYIRHNVSPSHLVFAQTCITLQQSAINILFFLPCCCITQLITKFIYILNNSALVIAIAHCSFQLLYKKGMMRYRSAFHQDWWIVLVTHDADDISKKWWYRSTMMHSSPPRHTHTQPLTSPSHSPFHGTLSSLSFSCSTHQSWALLHG